MLFGDQTLPGTDNALFGEDVVTFAGTPSLGYYQAGDVVTLAVQTSGTPDAPPRATITDPSSALVASFLLPMAGNTSTFALPVRLWGGLILGTYQVNYSYAILGVPATGSDTFALVAGGDSGGEVISLYYYDRPEGRYVVAQLSSGKLVQGRNPHL